MSYILNRLKEINAYKNYSHDDRGLGDLFADIYKNQCRYNITTKSWYIYDGKHWKEDKENTNVSRYAKQLYDNLRIYSLTLENEQNINEYSKYIQKLGSLRNRKIMIEDAKDKYPISNEDLDKDNYLFNCQNGTFNLRTFKFQNHNSSDLISKISNVIYNSNSKSKVFYKFICEILENDTEKIEYLQKILGYTLTGNNNLEEFYIFYGPSTRNGKSTCIEAIINMLGGTNGYAITISPDSLATKQFLDGRQASGDIARLKGYRFVNASEPQQNMSINASLLKTLTGRDTITAREIYHKSFEFKPTFKLYINTNYLPVIYDNTLFTSNRIRVVKFNKHFTEAEQNKNLKEELCSQEVVNEIFNWCIEGLKKFNTTGAIPPKTVINDTEEYQLSNDKLEIFISECLKKSEINSKASEIYVTYKDWLAQNGYPIESKQQFFSHLRAKNIFSAQGTVNGKTIRNIVIGYTNRNSIKN